MAKQLDILALEPFYGGVRKQTLESIARHSRHRWTIFKLPPRRMERRLNTAAVWFSQQFSRASGTRCDAIYSSDAMNLADFVRMVPDLAHKPSVAYFYGNQFAIEADSQARMAMLSTANTASEIWFNSLFHMKSFLSNAAAFMDTHPELGGKQPVRSLIAKSQLVHPPVEIVAPSKDSKMVDADRKGRTICLDCRESQPKIFAEVLTQVVGRKEPVAIYILGKAPANIPSSIPIVIVDGKSEAELIRTLRHCEMYISAQPAETFDPLAMRAMALGCIPILPQLGFYAEFLPKNLRAWCLHDGTAADLLSRLMDLWYLRRPAVARKELDDIFDRYTPILATRNFDRRLEYLVEQQSH